MVTDERKFEQTEMTKIVISALRHAISTIRPFAAYKDTLAQYVEMLTRLEKENLDVRLQSRDY